MEFVILNVVSVLPNLDHEIELWNRGFMVIGIDEVGRGAFAGPLFVGGVVFSPTKSEKQQTKLLSYGIKDSKKLKPNERKLLAKVIQSECLACHISHTSVAEINRIGVGKATFVAMRDVVKNLRETLKHQGVTRSGGAKWQDPERMFVLVDGFPIRNLRGLKNNQRAIIGGDNISLSIAAASIIAKVARDNHMKELAAKYKSYKWSKNKGYGTFSHRQAISKFGPTPLHRKDFIKNYI